jgi:hypothetical protein
MRLAWLGMDGSHFCVRLEETNLLPEWHVVGQVQLRQVYEAVAPQFYAMVDDPSRPGAPIIAARTCDVEEAKKIVEREYLRMCGS